MEKQKILGARFFKRELPHLYRKAEYLIKAPDMGGKKIVGSYLAETHVRYEMIIIHCSRDESLTLSDLKKPEVLKFA